MQFGYAWSASPDRTPVPNIVLLIALIRFEGWRTSFGRPARSGFDPSG
jgi:hypothetical protein